MSEHPVRNEDQEDDRPPVHRILRSIIADRLGNEGDRVFDHHGPIGEDQVRTLLDRAEKHSLDRADPVLVRKRLFSILVEGLENINRHAGRYRMQAGAVLADNSSGYDICLGNVVPVMSGAMMESRICMLNEMDAGVLKEQYLMLLGHEGRTGRGGAGIGLYTMARKCTRPMQVYMAPLTDRLACLVLRVRVAR
jgi:hypothetical protein